MDISLLYAITIRRLSFLKKWPSDIVQTEPNLKVAAFDKRLHSLLQIRSPVHLVTDDMEVVVKQSLWRTQCGDFRV